LALTLVEMAKLEQSPLKQGIISGLLFETNVMQVIPWETIAALSTTVIRFATLPSVGFRYVNDVYAESTGTFDQLQESVYPMGGDIDVDIMHIMNKAAVASPRATQTEMKLKAMAYNFNDYFVNGDQGNDAKGIDGIKKRVAQLAAAQTLTAATNGLDVIASAANSQAFIDLLDQACYNIDGHLPDALLANKNFILRMRSVFRRIGLLDQTKDQFGRFIDHYGGVPIYDVGVKADQVTFIIPNTETQGTATDASSVYAVKLGSETYLGGIQEYSLRVADFGELESKPAYRTRVDWPIGVGSWHPRCIVRLQGLRMNT